MRALRRAVKTSLQTIHGVLVPSVVCLSSGTFVRFTQPVKTFGNVSTHLLPWRFIDIHGKFYADRPRGTPPLGLAKYSDFRLVKGYISQFV